LRLLKALLLSLVSGLAALFVLSAFVESGGFLLAMVQAPELDPVTLSFLVSVYLGLGAVVVLIATVSLWVLRIRRLWAFVVLPIALTFGAVLFFPPEADEIIFSIGGSYIAILAVWGMTWGDPNLANSQRAGSAARIATLLLVCAALGLAINAYVTASHEDEDVSASDYSAVNRVMGAVATPDELLIVTAAGTIIPYKMPDWQPGPSQGEDVVKAVHDQSGIWILSITPLPDNRQYDDPLPEGKFIVSRYEGGKLLPLSTGDFGQDDRPVALLVKKGQPIVVGRKSIHAFDPAHLTWKQKPLTRPLQIQGGSTIADAASPSGAPDEAYLGFNAGEWGGGIWRVNLNSGKSDQIERRDNDELCSGPLNADCNPVTGIVTDPERPACVIAAIGLRHMLEHGGLVRICGDEVTILVQRSTARTALGRAIRRAVGQNKKSLDFSTEPFFDMTLDASGRVWTVSPYGVYRVDGTQLVKMAWPNLEQHGRLRGSAKVPGLIVLETDMNGRHSLSGDTPLIVAIHGR
jgi:hypothetical protein